VLFGDSVTRRAEKTGLSKLTLYLKADRLMKGLELDGLRLGNPGLSRPAAGALSLHARGRERPLGHPPGTQEPIPGIEIF
jgi:hypothetical protein